MYSESVFGFSGVLFVDVADSLSVVVGGSAVVINSLKTEDSLVGVLSNFGSASKSEYLRKLRNLALTQRRTCLPGPLLAIFLAFYAASGIW